MEHRQLTDNFKKALSHARLKYTPPREKVFMTLVENGAQTNAEIANRLAGIVDRATVYRTLESFERIHLIKRIWNGWKSNVELSDLFVAHHHHATCDNCGQSLRLESDALEKVLQALAKKHAFTMKDHSVELRGLCKDCVS